MESRSKIKEAVDNSSYNFFSLLRSTRPQQSIQFEPKKLIGDYLASAIECDNYEQVKLYSF